MVVLLSKDARAAVLAGAVEEARRVGDRRVRTEHLLLGLLRDPDSEAARILGCDLSAARAASARLDREALAAVGIAVNEPPAATSAQGRRRPPFTSGARAALRRAVLRARGEGARRIGERHLLMGILGARFPDSAAELLVALGVDAPDVLRSLAGG